MLIRDVIETMDEKLLPYTCCSDKQPCRGHRMLEVAGRIAYVLFVCIFTIPPVMFLVGVPVQLYVDLKYPSRPPEMYAVVDGASGLEARVPRAFNLTVTIDNLGSGYDVDNVGGDAVVLYGGVPLATGRVQGVRVPPHSAGKVAILTASGGVGLPGELAGKMDEESERAGGVVQLELRVVSLEHASLFCTAKLNLLSPSAAPVPSSPCTTWLLEDQSDGVMKHTTSTF
ncbi:hypothetical protein ACP4OV_004309 [Aristida adscensionis]